MGMQKKRIGIIGIGGVGGYYGGRLARLAEATSGFEVIFIMRDENKKQVETHGLRVVTPSESFTVRPTLVSDDPEAIGSLDMLICCAKGYDLKQAVIRYQQCVHAGTIVLPLLNGVENTEILQGIFPESMVLKGCAYIVSKKEGPGNIAERGNSNEILFGPVYSDKSILEWFIAILEQAGIHYTYTDSIDLLAWKKFMFVCAIGTLTSYLDQPIGFILETAEHKATLIALMSEIAELATARGIDLGPGVIPEALEKMGKLPYETTSSLQADFKLRNRTELESLTGYVIKTSPRYHLEAPVHAGIYEALKQRTREFIAN